jgi:RNA polymerase sigma-70 factor (ECF subfamily)
VRAALGSRWKARALAGEIEDSVQEVFLECLREGGALERASPEHPGGFKAFLYGVVRNVALRVEKRAALAHRRFGQDAVELEELGDDEKSLSRAFDEAWARSIVLQAARRQAERAAEAGDRARRRVELLRLRFYDNLPIREIAARWGDDAAAVHEEYRQARKELRLALLEVLAFPPPGAAAEVESECARLLESFR